jgi:uncharacterized protein
MLKMLIFRNYMRAISKQRQLVEQHRRNMTIQKPRSGLLSIAHARIFGKILRLVLKAFGLESAGLRNAMEIKVKEVTITMDNLPAGFDNTRILFMSDLHIGGLPFLPEKIIEKTRELDYDFCVLGGDYCTVRSEKLVEVSGKLAERTAVYAVLGNYERYEAAELLNEQGVEVLINDGVTIEKNGEKIYIAGLDDCCGYHADDIELADSSAGDSDFKIFKIMITHSPQKYSQIADAGYSLLLAGHTHGGQICLPGGFAPAFISFLPMPYKMMKGFWRWRQMAGYTTSGVGVSGVYVRFFCPGEIIIITLKQKKTVST